jgi:hypothetical protein
MQEVASVLVEASGQEWALVAVLAEASVIA